MGCNTMQIFARNPRQFRKGSLKKQDVKIFREKVNQAGIHPLIIHTPYTLNLAAQKEFLYRISIKEFIKDIKEAGQLGAQYIVIHAGSFKDDEREGLERLVDAVKIVVRNTPGIKTEVLLENTAGEGSTLGYTLTQLGFVFRKLSRVKRAGLCLDTAHAWGAGYRINTNKGLNSFVKEMDKEFGIKRLKLIHLNDNPYEAGSRKDRHAHIGEGRIGRAGFKLIVNHPALRDVPFILETPKSKESDDIKNLSLIKEFYKSGLHQRN